MGRSISHKTRRQFANALLSTGPQENASLDCKVEEEPTSDAMASLKVSKEQGGGDGWYIVHMENVIHDGIMGRKMKSIR